MTPAENLTPPDTWRTRDLLWSLVRFRPWLYAVDLLSWTISHVFPLVPGLVIKAFFDTLTGAAPAAVGVPGLVALLLATSLARMGTDYVSWAVDILYRFSVAALLRRNMLAQVLAQPGARALPEGVGEAISRFRDDPEVVEDALSWSLDVVGVGVLAAAALAILVSVDARMTAFVFLPLVAVVAASAQLRERLKRYREASRTATARVTGALGEMFGATQALQVAGAEAHAVAHFRRINEARRQAMVRDRVLTQVLQSLSAHTVSLATGLVLLVSAGPISGGAFTLGDLALFVYYMGSVSDFTVFLGRYLAHYTQTGVSFRRMLALVPGMRPADLVRAVPLRLSEPPAAPAAEPQPERERLVRLEAHGLSYRHPASGRGIEGVDLALPRGSLTVVTGRIGAGKTTLLRALLGLLAADAGEVRWNGRRIVDPAAWFVPPRCAYTPQVPRLFSAPLRENVRLGLAADDDSVYAALRLAVLERDLGEMPAGLDTLVGTRGLRLSGGQVQRAAAARMFVREPELLVFDDLSSALDVETEQVLWGRVFARPGVTCLVVSHRRAVLRRADHILLLDAGRLVDQGRLDELLGRSALMRALWREAPARAS